MLIPQIVIFIETIILYSTLIVVEVILKDYLCTNE